MYFHTFFPPEDSQDEEEHFKKKAILRKIRYGLVLACFDALCGRQFARSADMKKSTVDEYLRSTGGLQIIWAVVQLVDSDGIGVLLFPDDPVFAETRRPMFAPDELAVRP